MSSETSPNVPVIVHDDEYLRMDAHALMTRLRSPPRAVRPDKHPGAHRSLLP